jgi:hypothetical protein
MHLFKKKLPKITEWNEITNLTSLEEVDANKVGEFQTLIYPYIETLINDQNETRHMRSYIIKLCHLYIRFLLAVIALKYIDTFPISFSVFTENL